MHTDIKISKIYNLNFYCGPNTRQGNGPSSHSHICPSTRPSIGPNPHSHIGSSISPSIGPNHNQRF